MRCRLLVLPLVSISLGAAAALLRDIPPSKAGDVVKLAEGVYFRHGELETNGHCNNGIIIFEDFVLVIDANFPGGAEACLADIRKLTQKPVRFVFDTHHHGDHAYGNPTWLKSGAVPVAHEGVSREMARLEPGRWKEALGREDVKATGRDSPVPPILTFPDRMVIDDGTMRVELFHLGTAHTRGDGFAYLPREKVLFTGDVVVNGPHNFMGDGNSESWVEVIQRLERLDVEVVAPGHGPLGAKSLLADQREYFSSLRAEVAARLSQGVPAADLAAAVRIPDGVKRYVGMMFAQQVAKVRSEMLGLEMPIELERLGLRPGPGSPSKSEGWKPPRKIIYAGEAANARELEAVAGEARIVLGSSPEDIIREAADADAVIGRITPEIIRAGKKLRWVHSISAGVEQYVGAGDAKTPGIEDLLRSDIVLTNGRRTHGPNISDQVFAYLLAFTRGVKRSIEARAAPGPSGADGPGEEDRWKAAGLPKEARVELRGKTILIVGLGGIGGEVARRARAFGMDVLAVDPDVEPDAGLAAVLAVHPTADLMALLPRADVVVLSCPLTKATRGLFGAEQFAAMRDGAYFINVGRGRLIDTAALASALRRGKVAGAGLDVTEPEPLPDSSPLWGLENVIITPHSAGDADGSRRRARLLVRENIRRFVAGEPLLNVVDKEKGY